MLQACNLLTTPDDLFIVISDQLTAVLTMPHLQQTLVHLNVGGTLYETTAATLTSPLAAGSKLLGLWQSFEDQVRWPSMGGPVAVDRGSPNRLFIDRDGPSFRYVLNFLRNNGQLVPPCDLYAAKQLLQEAAYYELPGLVALMQQHISALEQPVRQHAQPPFAAELPRPQGPTAACQSAIIEVMRGGHAVNNYLDQGLHQDRIAEMLAGRYNRATVAAALQDLMNDALVYNTIDDFHYKLT